MDPKPRDAEIAPQDQSNVADHIFYKDWVVEGLHGHVPLIGTLEKCIDRR